MQRFFISEVLEEITFFSEDENTISALIVSKQGDCSLYANVEKKLLKGDLLKLNAEKLLLLQLYHYLKVYQNEN
jgi:hypothetical protein